MIGFYFAAELIATYSTWEVWWLPEYAHERYLFVGWVIYWLESLYWEMEKTQ